VLKIRGPKEGKVSIPQSGFLVVTPGCRRTSPFHKARFNPSVGILGGHTRAGTGATRQRRSFNPSVGILGGHTQDDPPTFYALANVSIPQSGFLVVTLRFS